MSLLHHREHPYTHLDRQLWCEASTVLHAGLRVAVNAMKWKIINKKQKQHFPFFKPSFLCSASNAVNSRHLLVTRYHAHTTGTLLNDHVIILSPHVLLSSLIITDVRQVMLTYIRSDYIDTQLGDLSIK